MCMPTLLGNLKENETLYVICKHFWFICLEKNSLGIKCQLQIRIMILIKKNVFEVIAGNVSTLLKLAA